VSKVIWQEATSLCCHPSRQRMPCVGTIQWADRCHPPQKCPSRGVCGTQCNMWLYMSHLTKRHCGRFICICTSHLYAQHTDTLTTLCASSVAIGCIYVMCADDAIKIIKVD